MRKRRKKSTENGRLAVEGLGAIGLIHAAPSATGRGAEKRWVEGEGSTSRRGWCSVHLLCAIS
jgi:hypothetical protein